MILGSGHLQYEPVVGWEKLPDGWSFIDVAGVAVDSHDNVYVLNRSEHPVHRLRPRRQFPALPGESVLSATARMAFMWGQTTASIAWMMACTRFANSPPRADCSSHWERKTSRRPNGRVSRSTGRLTLPCPPITGNLYVSDGYGNSRSPCFSPDGRPLHSWGEPGIDPGQFIRPHNVAIDKEDLVYVADRENHRIQVFEPKATTSPCGTISIVPTAFASTAKVTSTSAN